MELELLTSEEKDYLIKVINGALLAAKLNHYSDRGLNTKIKLIKEDPFIASMDFQTMEELELEKSKLVDSMKDQQRKIDLLESMLFKINTKLLN